MFHQSESFASNIVDFLCRISDETVLDVDFYEKVRHLFGKMEEDFVCRWAEKKMKDLRDSWAKSQ